MRFIYVDMWVVSEEAIVLPKYIFPLLFPGVLKAVCEQFDNVH